MADHLALINQPVSNRDEDDLCSIERLSDGNGNVIRIDAVGFPIAIEAQGRHHRNHSLIQQGLQQLRIDAFNFACEQVIDAMNDSHRMSDDGIRRRRPQIVR